MAIAGMLFSIFNPLHEPPPPTVPSDLFRGLHVLKVTTAWEKPHRQLRLSFGGSHSRGRTNRVSGQWEDLSSGTIWASEITAREALEDLEQRLRRLTRRTGAKITDSGVHDGKPSEFCFRYRLGAYQGKIAGMFSREPTRSNAPVSPAWRIKLWHQEWLNLPIKGGFDFDPEAPE
jgi:hypothetical protein